jgi:hypothetical protein
VIVPIIGYDRVNGCGTRSIDLADAVVDETGRERLDDGEEDGSRFRRPALRASR